MLEPRGRCHTREGTRGSKTSSVSPPGLPTVLLPNLIGVDGLGQGVRRQNSRSGLFWVLTKPIGRNERGVGGWIALQGPVRDSGAHPWGPI